MQVAQREYLDDLAAKAIAVSWHQNARHTALHNAVSESARTSCSMPSHVARGVPWAPSSTCQRYCSGLRCPGRQRANQAPPIHRNMAMASLRP